MTPGIRKYSDLLDLETFEERFEYLKLDGFLEHPSLMRMLNQKLYRTYEWVSIRRNVVTRDLGCDLGIADRPILGTIYVHHINPINVDDILRRTPFVLDPEYLICTSRNTHRSIHVGNLIPREEFRERTLGDTTIWRR